MTMLPFSEDDLEANRRGQLSDRQRQQIQQRYALLGYAVLIAAVSSALLAVIGVLLAQSIGTGFMLLMVALAVVELGILYPVIERFRRPFQDDLNESRVERIEGEVTMLPYRKRRAGQTALKIGDKQVYADRASFRALAAGGRYRVYIAPASSTLVSFERLDEQSSG